MFQAGVLKQLYNREGHAAVATLTVSLFSVTWFPEDQFAMNQLQDDSVGSTPQNLVPPPEALHVASVTLFVSSADPVHSAGGPCEWGSEVIYVPEFIVIKS